jgi:hypothetical protein
LGHFISFVDAKRDQLAQIMVAIVLKCLSATLTLLPPLPTSQLFYVELQTQVRGNMNLILLILLLITNIHCTKFKCALH